MDAQGKSGKIKKLLHDKASDFLHFAYNRKKGEFFGKTCKGWGQTIGFFIVFYSILAAVFAVHLTAFIVATPGPGRDSKPTNFGRYAYPNYPNAKIGLISVPGSFRYDGERASLSSSKRKDIRDLLNSANMSGVGDHCLDEDTDYGYSTGQPCIFLRLMKVFEWSPEMINTSLRSASHLPLSCLPKPSAEGVEVELLPRPAGGLPLNLPNHDNSRSYPFRGKTSSYITPVMGVIVNLTSLSTPAGTNNFHITITCGLNLTAVGMDNPPASLSRLHELPSDASTKITVRL